MIVHKDLAREVVLVDIKEGLAEGKALDIWQTSVINNFDTRVVGVTNDYLHTKGSRIVVITSGVPQKPGMNRDDLVRSNTIIIIVSNPLYVITYIA